MSMTRTEANIGLVSSAYDYDAQEWTSDPGRVRALIEAQCKEELAILVGPDAERYLRFIGCDRRTVERRIAALRARLG